VILIFDDDTIALLGAVITRNRELIMQTADDYARRLKLLGKPGPYKSSPHNSGAVTDRAGHLLVIISPDISGHPARRDAAEIAALALNRLCGFAAVEDQLDPALIAAMRIESDRFAAQARPAAE
jgi:hypothetical protein